MYFDIVVSIDWWSIHPDHPLPLNQSQLRLAFKHYVVSRIHRMVPSSHYCVRFNTANYNDCKVKAYTDITQEIDVTPINPLICSRIHDNIMLLLEESENIDRKEWEKTLDKLGILPKPRKNQKTLF